MYTIGWYVHPFTAVLATISLAVIAGLGHRP
jgi:hypothetical protein